MSGDSDDEDEEDDLEESQVFGMYDIAADHWQAAEGQTDGGHLHHQWGAFSVVVV